MSKSDHVVMRNDRFVCRHCGATYLMALPAPITVFVAATNAFVDLHKNCSKPEPKPE
jgi:rubredoxin